MLRFLRAALAVCSVLAIFTISMVALGRFIHTPDVLEILGLGLCQSDPCFEGIKPGTRYYDSSQLLSAGNIRTYIEAEPTGDKVAFIDVSFTDWEQPSPLGTAGTILERYGSPCRVELEDAVDGSSFYLIYPGLYALIAGGSRFNPDGYHLQMTSPVFLIRLTRHEDYGACDAPQTVDSGDWHGFIYENQYGDYFLKASSSP